MHAGTPVYLHRKSEARCQVTRKTMSRSSAGRLPIKRCIGQRVGTRAVCDGTESHLNRFAVREGKSGAGNLKVGHVYNHAEDNASLADHAVDRKRGQMCEQRQTSPAGRRQTLGEMTCTVIGRG
jgi:hypothetical protein